MQITGPYNNYLNLNTLLSPFGVKGSGDLPVQFAMNRAVKVKLLQLILDGIKKKGISNV